MEILDSLNYENIIEHVLVRARKIHESVLYQAFFYLFFELAKNEDGLDFSFLDSLNLYKKEGKGSSFTCIFHHGSKSWFLEQSTIFESINSWVLVFLPYPDSELITPPVGLFSNYMGNLSMSPTLQICFVGPFVSNAA